MKKVININLGGTLFAIELDAYEMLTQYLEDIKQHLSGTDDQDEIVADIESALAEKFLAKRMSERAVVTMTNVQTVKSEMGSPADFSEDNFSESDQSDTKAAPVKKRFYRDTDDAVVVGVASGVAQYLGIDPVVVRLIFVLTTLFSGIGLLVYVILWVAVPTAKTTVEKYAMSGDKVTLKEITERVKKDIEKVSSEKGISSSTVWLSVRNTLIKVFKGLGVLVTKIKAIARIGIGALLVVVGTLGTVLLVTVYAIIVLSDKNLLPLDVQIVVSSVLNGVTGIVAVIALFIVLLLPLQALLFTGVSLLRRCNIFSVGKVVALSVVWFVAVIVLITTATLQVEKVLQDSGVVDLENKTYSIQFDSNENGTAVRVQEIDRETVLSTSSSTITESF